MTAGSSCCSHFYSFSTRCVTFQFSFVYTELHFNAESDTYRCLHIFSNENSPRTLACLADADALPVSVGVEEVHDENLHGGPDGRQLYPDEERSPDVPLPPAPECRGGGGGDGESFGTFRFLHHLVEVVCETVRCVPFSTTATSQPSPMRRR